MEQTAQRRPFVHFVAQHRFVDTIRERPATLFEHLGRLAPYGEIRVTGDHGMLATFAALGKSGNDIAAVLHDSSATGPSATACRGLDGLLDSPACRRILGAVRPDKTASYTHMRRQMALACDARVQVGGRTTGFSGEMSGLCEEALVTVDAKKPLLVLGGFGGASRDIAASLGLVDPDDCVPPPPTPAPDRAQYENGLGQLRAARPRFEENWTPEALGYLQALARTESVIEAVELVAKLLAQRLPFGDESIA